MFLVVAPLLAALATFARAARRPSVGWRRARSPPAPPCSWPAVAARRARGFRARRLGRTARDRPQGRRPRGAPSRDDLRVGALVSLSVAADPRVGRAAAFWPLWLVLLAGLNAIYLSGDIFNIYVALEVFGLAAVGLTSPRAARRPPRGGLTYLFARLVRQPAFPARRALSLCRLRAGSTSPASRRSRAPRRRAGPGADLAGLRSRPRSSRCTSGCPPHIRAPRRRPAPSSRPWCSKASLYVALRLWLESSAPSDALGDARWASSVHGAVIWGSVQLVCGPSG